MQAAPEPVRLPAPLKRDGLLAIAVGLLLMVWRDWIILGHPMRKLLWVYGDPNVLLANKLSGWFHLGVVMGQWRRSWWQAGLFWEWLPPVVIAIGLYLFLRQFPAPLKIRLPRRLPWPALLPSGLLALAALLAWFCFGGIPHVQDSIAQQFQAQIFARGKLYAPTPAAGSFFANEFLVQHEGKWFAQYPPMQAALLALGVLAGVPWLVNPLLGAASAFILYRVARLAYGPRLALASLLLFVASPFVWFMSAERMNHAATLFFALLALYAFAPALTERQRRMPASRWFWGALALGLAASTRPLCGAAVALPLLMGALWPRKSADAETERPEWLVAAAPYLAAVVAGLILGAAPMLIFNWATTGSPLLSGYQVQWGSSGWGFGKSQWGPPHTPWLGLQHLLANWDGAAKYLFETPLPSLLPLVGLCFLPRWTRMDRVLMGIMASLTLAYFPYFFQDLCLGPRFLYAGAPAFMMLSARGILAAGAAWGAWRARRPRQGVILATQLTAFCMAAGVVLNGPVLLHWYGHNFWGTDARLVNAARAMKVAPAVVFIRDYAHARALDMQDLGVSRRMAQGAVEELEEGWLDELIDEATVQPRAVRGEWLEERLEAALLDPLRKHRRLHPPWVDAQGFTASVYSGLWANTPWPEQQDIVFALDRGPRNREFLQRYPNRTPWRFEYEGQSMDFCLMPYSLQREDIGVRLTRNGAPARKPKTP